MIASGMGDRDASRGESIRRRIAMVPSVPSPDRKRRWCSVCMGVGLIALLLVQPVSGEANEYEEQSLQYLYVGSSLSYGAMQGVGALGFGSMVTDPWGRYGFEIGLAFPWWRDAETEALMGLEGRLYWATGGRVAVAAGIGALLATNVWFFPLDEDNPPQSPDDGSSVEGVVAVVLSAGIIFPSATSIQMEGALRPVMGLSTQHGAFLSLEIALVLRAGGLF